MVLASLGLGCIYSARRSQLSSECFATDEGWTGPPTPSVANLMSDAESGEHSYSRGFVISDPLPDTSSSHTAQTEENSALGK